MEPIDLFALLPDLATIARGVDAGNFSAAARELGTTPSTVSRQIKRFDEPADLANDVGARLDAALDGWGIANLPEFAAANALRRGDLVPALADWQCEAGPYMGPIWLLYPPNRFFPSQMRVLIDHLASHLHDTGAA
ncbi:LysR family transcriptional regulator [Burkholderia sp. 22PA0106]|uniref:LysR family transcriptional regulator n=1 Tax=Burkholderia sp. 22PA0106 TaxID=3237371 RepID=UPI0039C29BA9